MSKENNTNKAEKVSWRQRRAEKRLAKAAVQAAMKEAEDTIEAMPESRIKKAANKAFDYALGQRGRMNVSDYRVDYGQFPDTWPAQLTEVKTIAVNASAFGIDKKDTMFGFVACLKKTSRYASRDLLTERESNGDDILYLATYNTTTKTGTVQELTPGYLAGLGQEDLEQLAEISEGIANVELGSYIKYHRPD